MNIPQIAVSFVMITSSVWPARLDAMLWQGDKVTTSHARAVSELKRAIELGRGIRIRSGDTWILLNRPHVEGNGISFDNSEFVPFGPATEIQVHKRTSSAIVGGALLGGVVVGGVAFILGQASTSPCSGIGDLFCGLDQGEVRSNTLRGAAIGALVGGALGTRKRWVTLRF